MDIPDLNNESNMSRPQGSVRAVCVEIDQPNSWDAWPKYFSFPPRPGDLVKSGTGRVAKITNVMHITGAGDLPIAVLELTRDTGGSTPVEGSGGSLE